MIETIEKTPREKSVNGFLRGANPGCFSGGWCARAGLRVRPMVGGGQSANRGTWDRGAMLGGDARLKLQERGGARLPKVIHSILVEAGQELLPILGTQPAMPPGAG